MCVCVYRGGLGAGVQAQEKGLVGRQLDFVESFTSLGTVADSLATALLQFCSSAGTINFEPSIKDLTTFLNEKKNVFLASTQAHS